MIRKFTIHLALFFLTSISFAQLGNPLKSEAVQQIEKNIKAFQKSDKLYFITDCQYANYKTETNDGQKTILELVVKTWPEKKVIPITKEDYNSQKSLNKLFNITFSEEKRKLSTGRYKGTIDNNAVQNYNIRTFRTYISHRFNVLTISKGKIRNGLIQITSPIGLQDGGVTAIPLDQTDSTEQTIPNIERSLLTAKQVIIEVDHTVDQDYILESKNKFEYLSKKTLLIPQDLISNKISLEEIKEIYPYEIKITTKEDAENILKSDQSSAYLSIYQNKYKMNDDDYKGDYDIHRRNVSSIFVYCEDDNTMVFGITEVNGAQSHISTDYYKLNKMFFNKLMKGHKKYLRKK